MPESVLNQIKFLCKNISEVEWSGMLFYKVEGTIKDPENMVIHLKDILPMDKGSKAYTEYDVDERFINYLMDKPERMEWEVGHIHSHNTMSVFFSGTDDSELRDNSENHRYYLSLIVNNYMDFMAKVGVISQVEEQVVSVPYYAEDEDGNKYEVGSGNFKIAGKRMYTYDCEINSPQEPINVDQEFGLRVVDLFEREKALEAERRRKAAMKNAYNKTKNNTANQSKDVGFKKHAQTPPEDQLFPAKKFAEVYTSKNFEKIDEIEQLAMALYNFSNQPEAGDTLESILSELTDFEVTCTDVCKSVVAVYPNLYAEFFPDRDEKAFCSDTSELIEMLQEQEQVFPLISMSIEGLEQMLKQFQKDETRTTV